MAEVAQAQGQEQGVEGEAVKEYVGRREPVTLERWRDHYGWSQEQAERMATELAGRTEPRVYVVVNGVESELKHYPYHSPDGFEWGYGGSGPAELARCILLDFFEVVPEQLGHYYPPVATETPISYQGFKRAFIEPLDQSTGWTISGTAIRALLP